MLIEKSLVLNSSKVQLFVGQKIITAIIISQLQMIVNEETVVSILKTVKYLCK